MTAAPGAPEGEVIRTCQRAVRRRELRKIVPLADTTIYEMERRGEFPLSLIHISEPTRPY